MISILQEGTRIHCWQCGCHGFNLITKGYHCGMCSPVMGTKIKIKTMDNQKASVVKKGKDFDAYDVRLSNGKLAENVGILELEIIDLNPKVGVSTRDSKVKKTLHNEK